MRTLLRNPVWVIFGLIQPVLYLALFGPLLSRHQRRRAVAATNAWQVFVPGPAGAAGASSAPVFAGFGIIQELRRASSSASGSRRPAGCR